MYIIAEKRTEIIRIPLDASSEDHHFSIVFELKYSKQYQRVIQILI